MCCSLRPVAKLWRQSFAETASVDTANRNYEQCVFLKVLVWVCRLLFSTASPNLSARTHATSNSKSNRLYAEGRGILGPGSQDEAGYLSKSFIQGCLRLVRSRVFVCGGVCVCVCARLSVCVCGLFVCLLACLYV